MATEAEPAGAEATLALAPASVSTLGGSGSSATVNGTGTGASFSDLTGAVVVGNSAYVASTGTIRKVDLSTGQVSTLAGRAGSFDCTENEDPTAVRFSTITAMATDGTSLYTIPLLYKRSWDVSGNAGSRE
jgi:hypothetical protein